jgi:hypothetical protein
LSFDLRYKAVTDAGDGSREDFEDLYLHPAQSAVMIGTRRGSHHRFAEDPMPSQTKSQQLAKKFDVVYAPKSLADRLEWWCHVLGIDRTRLLQMMGMSADEAKREKRASWSEFLKKKEWEENAWWVEGKLHELLVLFDYDWKALADRLHLPHEARRQELSRVTRGNGDIVKLQYVPSKDSAEILLNQLAKGGPESFPALISYLAHERSS